MKSYFDRKIKILYHIYSKDDINIKATVKKFKTTRNTLKKYINELRVYKENTTPDKDNINSYVVYLKNIDRNYRTFSSLKEYFPKVYDSIKNLNSNRKIEWEKYNDNDSIGISYTQFAFHFSRWLKENNLEFRRKINPIQNIEITDDDRTILKKWRRSTDRRKWEKAVVLLDLEKGCSITDISNKIERSRRKVIRWAKAYQNNGVISLETKKKKLNEGLLKDIEIKKSNLMKLIHETPKNHGINRASWDLKSLSKAYYQVYKIRISRTTISEYVKSLGYGFCKAKKVLTSPDPQYREKLKKITSILENLKENEKFFSVDEFGPFAIKMQGGRSLVKKGETKIYPQWQKSKGRLICTAALELSENQVTHFYSDKKNTDEMIKLLETLLFKYKSDEKIYFSWDAASWHASKKLKKRLSEVNSTEYRIKNKTPLVELAPLPASAQFLNVIESVFSGMAKAIIHNSNYQSVEECKTAIDTYFSDRNKYFKENPKRAGNKIWGKEKIKPVFDETKNSKDPRWR
jgi:transposase